MGTILYVLFKDLFDLLAEVLSEIFEQVFLFCTANPLDGSWATFSWVDATTLYIQAFALAVVVALRIAAGITGGIFANGGDPSTGETAGAWLYHSLYLVVIVCAMPTLARWMCGLASDIAADMIGIARRTSFENSAQAILENLTRALGLGADPIAGLVNVVLAVVFVYYIGSIIIMCLKRQVQLVVMSVVAPLTCIGAASQDFNTADLRSIARDALWLGVNNGIQLTLLATAIGMAVSPPAEIAGILYPPVLIAVFAATKKVPEWLEKYVPNPVQAGQGGSRAATAGGGFLRTALIMSRWRR